MDIDGLEHGLNEIATAIYAQTAMQREGLALIASIQHVRLEDGDTGIEDSLDDTLDAINVFRESSGGEGEKTFNITYTQKETKPEAEGHTANE